MSRTIWLRVLMALATSCLLVIGVLTSAPAKAAESSPPPPPTVIDRCGTAQDEFVTLDNGFYYLDSVGNWYEPGTHSSQGASVVSLVVERYSPYAQWNMTITFTNQPCAAEAPNGYSITVGSCYSDGSRKVMPYFTNVADATGYSVPEISVSAESLAGSWTAFPPSVTNVLDGQTVAIEGLALVGYQGLKAADATTRSETYKFRFERNDGAGWYDVGPIITKRVPYCGDGSVGPGTPGATTGKAYGTLTKLKGKMRSRTWVRVSLDAKRVNGQVQKTVPYRIVRQYSGKVKGTKVKTYTVKAGARKAFNFKVKSCNPRKVRVVVTLQVKRPNGGWATLRRVTVPRC